MKKILYGVSGEGSGHSSRARVIIKHLEARGHVVKVVSYDRGFRNLSPNFDVSEIFGLHFSYFRNKVEPISTVYKNLIKSPKALKSINKVSKIAKEFKPDIVFSDFEPISAFVANLKRIPLVSIDNQHRISSMKLDYPSKYTKDYLLAKSVVNLMLVNTKACLITSFFDSPVESKKTFIFPPILRDEVVNLKTQRNDYILVYLTNEFAKIPKVLKTINKNFIVYGFNKEEVDANLEYKKHSSKGFLDDLSNCEAVLANAGFTLITEALYLAKPYLALPIKGQFEQVLNAYYLEKLSYGKYWDKLNKEKIESFLFNIEMYYDNLKAYERQDNSKILQKVDDLLVDLT